MRTPTESVPKAPLQRSSGAILPGMAEGSDSKRIKSAYELALERMESEGIDRPREAAFSPEVLADMDAARSKAKAKLAELEILYRKKLDEIVDPAAAALEEREYRAECERIESRRDRDIEKLRNAN